MPQEVTGGRPYHLTNRFDPSDTTGHNDAVQGAVAQLGERCVRNAEVEGSIPFGSILSILDNDTLSLSSAILITARPKYPLRGRLPADDYGVVIGRGLQRWHIDAFEHLCGDSS